MAMVCFAFFGLLGSFLIIAAWAGADMMFGIGFSYEAAQGLALFVTALGAIVGGVLTVIFS